MNKATRFIGLAILASFAVAGCGGGDDDVTVTQVPRRSNIDPEDLVMPTFSTMPGLPVAQATDTDKLFRTQAVVVASRYGGPRSDPFALKASERGYETNQNTERVLGDMGSWVTLFTPEEEKDPMAGIITEPQPYRRLSGIIVGDSVYAILESGGQTEIIRPGMRIPNTEWTVVSIDEEKAILRRPGNTLPNQVTVRLEVPAGGVPGTGAGGAGRPPGPGGAMAPGGPGGRPGPGGVAPGGPSPGGGGGQSGPGQE